MKNPFAGTLIGLFAFLVGTQALHDILMGCESGWAAVNGGLIMFAIFGFIAAIFVGAEDT